MTPSLWLAAHASRIEAAARNLHRRWPLPAAVGVEDVAQEMRLGAALAWDRWDPAYGRSRDHYLWLAMATAARDWLHAQRGARRGPHRARLSAGQAPGAYPLAVSGLGLDDVDMMPGAAMAPDEAADLLRVVRRVLASSRAERVRRCVDALTGGRYATGDWHARVLTAHSIDMFSEVQDGEGARRGDRQGERGGGCRLGGEVRAPGG